MPHALVGRSVVVKLSEAINLDEIAVGLPSRIHDVTLAKAPDRIALVEDGASWSYRDLEQRVSEIAAVLSTLGIRAGDRMVIVSENCIALAALLLATSRLATPMPNAICRRNGKTS